jgi:hypothetical protein
LASASSAEAVIDLDEFAGGGRTDHLPPRHIYTLLEAGVERFIAEAQAEIRDSWLMTIRRLLAEQGVQSHGG